MKPSAWIGVALSSLAPSVALAADPSDAEILFRDALTLVAQGNYPAACPKLEESERLDPGMGTLYHLGDCHEHTGKVVAAFTEFASVADQAKERGQKPRETAARARADALEKRVPHLWITGAPPMGAVIRRDAVPMNANELSVALPMDAGQHEITVSLAGHQTWRMLVTLVEGKTTRVVLPTDLPGDDEVAAAPPVPAQPEAAAVSTPVAPESKGNPALRATGIALVGAGLAGIGVGTYFGVRSMDKRDDARAHCSGNACDASGVSLRNDAISSGNAATVAFVAGAVASVAGAALIITPMLSESHGDDHPKSAMRSVAAAPWIAPGSGGIAISGVFR